MSDEQLKDKLPDQSTLPYTIEEIDLETVPHLPSSDDFKKLTESEQTAVLNRFHAFLRLNWLGNSLEPNKKYDIQGNKVECVHDKKVRAKLFINSQEINTDDSRYPVRIYKQSYSIGRSGHETGTPLSTYKKEYESFSRPAYYVCFNDNYAILSRGNGPLRVIGGKTGDVDKEKTDKLVKEYGKCYFTPHNRVVQLINHDRSIDPPKTLYIDGQKVDIPDDVASIDGETIFIEQDSQNTEVIYLTYTATNGRKCACSITLGVTMTEEEKKARLMDRHNQRVRVLFEKKDSETQKEKEARVQLEQENQALQSQIAGLQKQLQTAENALKEAQQLQKNKEQQHAEELAQQRSKTDSLEIRYKQTEGEMTDLRNANKVLREENHSLKNPPKKGWFSRQ